MSWPPYGEALLALADAHPLPDVLAELVRAGRRADLEVVATLWLSEGIPHAFAKHPALYEHIRRALGTRLDVHPRDISITGSRRTGYSMKPVKWGAPARPDSDFDLLIVDAALFQDVAEDFHSWATDFREGRAVPKGRAEQKWWRVNADEGPRDIERGFLAPLMRIPLRPAYASVRRMSQAVTVATYEARRLAKHVGIRELLAGKKPLRIRVYQDWRWAVDGIRRSLTFTGLQMRQALIQTPRD